MKITASTGAIADAFVLAASLSADDKCAKKIATLEAIRIKTADSAALVSGNILDHAQHHGARDDREPRRACGVGLTSRCARKWLCPH